MKLKHAGPWSKFHYLSGLIYVCVCLVTHADLVPCIYHLPLVHMCKVVLDLCVSVSMCLCYEVVYDQYQLASG